MTFLPYEQGKIACLCGGRSWPLVDDRERSRSGDFSTPSLRCQRAKGGGELLGTRARLMRAPKALCARHHS